MMGSSSKSVGSWPSWVTDSVQMGLVLIDLQGHISHFNRWMSEKSGLSLADVSERNILDVFPELRTGRVGMALAACRQSGLPAMLSNSLNPTPFPLYADATQRALGQRLQQSIRMMRSPLLPDRPQQVMVEILDVTSAVRRERMLNQQALQLKKMSSTDPLTGLANRRVLDDVLEREFRRATRNHSTLAVAMVDIDAFKSYNDTYGHPAGDKCLMAVAQCMRDILRRPMDLVARYGGEEFMVVMPDTSLEGAAAVAQEMRLAVQALHMPHSSSSHEGVVTISLGVAAAMPTEVQNCASLVAHADVALYAAKRAGRNRVAALRGSTEVHPDIDSIATVP